ncbi:MAG: T9SS type A sorting domain-containing protein [Saprospiraceae bacterium]|nr:T9SS type A sorting domain-containing protein [Saprospiraceae bacterium]
MASYYLLIYFMLWITPDASFEMGECKNALNVVLYSEKTIQSECIEQFSCQCPTGLANFNIDATISPYNGEVNLTTLINLNTLPANYIENSCIRIKGRLIVDITYEMSSCEILMEPGAEIVVRGTNTKLGLLNMNDSRRLHGCTAMWRGITVEPDAFLALKAAWIEDAQYAIKPLNKSNISIRASTFVNNYIGLYFNGPIQQPESFFLHPFMGNSFIGTGIMLSEFEGQTPEITSDIPEAAIEIFNQAGLVHIGVSGNALNSIENMENGILTQNTPLWVENTMFEHINYAIHHSGGAAHPITVVGFGMNGNSSFDDCLHAITVIGTDVNIQNNNMTPRCLYPISISMAQNRNINIRNNNLIYRHLGIMLAQCDPVHYLSVAYNTIEMDIISFFDMTAAICVAESGVPHTYASIGPKNRIHLNMLNTGDEDDQYAIMMESVNNYTITDNVIFDPTDYQHTYGIALMQGGNCTVSNNLIEGSGTDNPSAAIYALSTYNSKYDCNEVGTLYTGMEFSGVCTASDIQTNTFIPPMQIGLSYDQTLDINEQLHEGNIWLPTPNYLMAAAENRITIPSNPNISIFTELSSMRYEVENNSPPLYPNSFSFPNLPLSPSLYSSSWFPISTGTTAECGDTEGLYSIPSLDYKIISGSPFWGDYAENRRWQAQRQLLRRIEKGDVGEQSVYQQFYDQYSDSLVGAYHQHELNIQDLWFHDSSEHSLIQTLTQELSIVARGIVLEDSLLAIEIGNWANWDSLHTTYLEKSNLVDSLDGVIKAKRLLSVEEELNNNSELPVVSVIQSNEKAINDIYLRTIAKGINNFTPTQDSIISSIAAYCPFYGGEAVMKARSLELLAGRFGNYDDECLENPMSILESNVGALSEIYASRSETALNMSVYPNPASDDLTVVLNSEEVLWLTINDMQGRERMLHTLASNHSEGDKLSIDITTIPSGVYQLIAFNKDGMINMVRFAVVR